ncbi:hypothetical protein [Dysgonomonas sp. Marseille-P4361]|uniref:hypothetical protein n=1 Tax=Dysgonomonas sp. Marseille-P4361 TaxID=2161820 RepID=UPI000D561830|nr:hypothetical protein [Dysgonomonas sp. Marseille-P4361]
MKQNRLRSFFIILVTLSIFLPSCNSKDRAKDIEIKDEKEFTYIHLISDSLQTPEQKAFVDRLNRIVSENTKIENNHFCLTISEDDFVKQGFPAEYYTLMKKNYEEMNNFIDSQLIEDPRKIWLDAVYEYNNRKGNR